MSDDSNPTPNPLHVFCQVRAGVGQANPIPEGPPGRKILRAWTVMDAESVRVHGPVHNVNAFMEERIHDWDLDKHGRMRFYSRVVATGEQVEVVLDYETWPERQARTKALGGESSLPGARKPKR